MQIIGYTPIKSGVDKISAWVDEAAQMHVAYVPKDSQELYHAETKIKDGNYTKVRIPTGTLLTADKVLGNIEALHVPGHKVWFLWPDRQGMLKEAIYVDEPYVGEATSPYKLYYAVDTQRLFMNIDDNWEFIGSPNLDQLVTDGSPNPMMFDVYTKLYNLETKLAALAGTAPPPLYPELTPKPEGPTSYDLVVDFNSLDDYLDLAITRGGYTFAPGTYLGDSVLASNNTGINSSSSTMSITFTIPTAGSIDFDYLVSSESRYDIFKISFTGSADISVSGSTSWTTVTKELDAGTYTLSLTYTKDSSSSSGSDKGYIRNLIIRGLGA